MPSLNSRKYSPNMVPEKDSTNDYLRSELHQTQVFKVYIHETNKHITHSGTRLNKSGISALVVYAHIGK